MLIAALAIAGAIGAPLRYLIDGAVQDRTGGEFPFGTLVVNLTASIAVGFITGLALYRGFPDTPRIVVATGAAGVFDLVHRGLRKRAPRRERLDRHRRAQPVRQRRRRPRRRRHRHRPRRRHLDTHRAPCRSPCRWPR